MPLSSFPAGATDGQSVIVNGVSYTYNAAADRWTGSFTPAVADAGGGGPSFLGEWRGVMPLSPSGNDDDPAGDFTFTFSNMDTTKPLFVRFLIGANFTEIRDAAWQIRATQTNSGRATTLTDYATSNTGWDAITVTPAGIGVSVNNYFTETPLNSMSSDERFVWLRHPSPSANQTLTVGKLAQNSINRSYYITAYQ